MKYSCGLVAWWGIDGNARAILAQATGGTVLSRGILEGMLDAAPQRQARQGRMKLD
jgi:hypothetical protein